MQDPIVAPAPDDVESVPGPIWSGASNGISCASVWVDDRGAYIGLYADVRTDKHCRVAVAATRDGQTSLQVLVDGQIEIINLADVVRLVNKAKTSGEI